MIPYEKNTYFFVSLPEPAMDAILEHTVEGTIDDAAKLFDGSYLIKLPIDIPVPAPLSHLTSYNHAGMLIEKAIREQGREIL